MLVTIATEKPPPINLPTSDRLAALFAVRCDLLGAVPLSSLKDESRKLFESLVPHAKEHIGRELGYRQSLNMRHENLSWSFGNVLSSLDEEGQRFIHFLGVVEGAQGRSYYDSPSGLGASSGGRLGFFFSISKCAKDFSCSFEIHLDQTEFDCQRDFSEEHLAELVNECFNGKPSKAPFLVWGSVATYREITQAASRSTSKRAPEVSCLESSSNIFSVLLKDDHAECTITHAFNPYNGSIETEYDLVQI